TNRNAGHDLLLPRPSLAATRVCSYGHVGNQPDWHDFFRRSLCHTKAARRQPLQKSVETQCRLMRLSEVTHRDPGWPVIFRGPVPPSVSGTQAGQEMLVQSL